jgi:hypothetical protein
VRTWQKKLGIGFLSGAVLGGYLIFRPKAEPIFEGRPLSYWVNGMTKYDSRIAAYFNGTSSDDVNLMLQHKSKLEEKAQQAVKQAGTNSLFFALKWITYKQAGWQLSLERLRQNSNWSWVPAWATGEENRNRGENAVYVFDWLGSNADPTIPQLTELARNADRNLSSRGQLALYAIGKPSFSAFVELISETNTPAHVRRGAIEFLDGLILNEFHLEVGTNASLAVPVLIRSLRDPDVKVATRAGWILGILGVESNQCVPALNDALKDDRPDVRKKAIEALQRFGVPASTNAITDPLN